MGVTMLLALFALGFVKIFREKLKKIGAENRKYNAEMNKWLLQGIGGIKEIKIMNREQFFCEQYDEAYSRYAECQRKFSLLGILPRPVMEMFSVSGLLLVVAFKLSQGVQTTYFVTTLSVFAVAAFRMLPSFNRITNNLNGIMFGKVSVDKVYEDLKQVEILLKKMRERDSERVDISFQNKITVRNVTFSYPKAEKPVLENVGLEIPKNSSVAFIGTSGSGKTTLADLILGVLEPDEGQICVDGKDVWKHMKGWQKKLGYIPQMIYIMDDTLKRNITISLSENEINEKKLWRAIEEAQLKDFVQSLENGVNTVIGENGMRLSGGQRQRIGIARALYRDPEILVLDEATSALDNETEAAIMDAIKNLSGSKTLIIIAHRLTTVKDCDIIYKVDNKKVFESKVII